MSEIFLGTSTIWCDFYKKLKQDGRDIDIEKDISASFDLQASEFAKELIHR
jgi:hypothetical protein